MNSTNVTYCDLKDIGKGFRVYYSYLSLLVCIFGSVTNVLNIWVLTTKHMRCPTNLILTGLAVADLLVMVEYIPFVFLHNRDKVYAYHFTYNFALFVVFHALFTQAFHFISCCLTVILAIWRYVAVKFPQSSNKWCSDARTKITILLTYLLCPVVCTPLYFSLKIFESEYSVDSTGKMIPPQNRSHTTHTNATIYLTGYGNNISKLISFYIYSVVIKLVPCILLTLLSFLLIKKLLEAKERRQNLMNSSRNKENGKRKTSQRSLEKEKQADRTTRMLLAVLLLFLMVEFPQAIFGLLNHVMGEKFQQQCYQPLGDLLDFFTLTNSSINFVLYCIMSKKFRTVFKEIFLQVDCCGIKYVTAKARSLLTQETYV